MGTRIQETPVETSSARKTWPNGYKSRFHVVRDPNDGVLYTERSLRAQEGQGSESSSDDLENDENHWYESESEQQNPHAKLSLHHDIYQAILQLAQIGATLIGESIHIAAIGLRCNLTSLWFIVSTNVNVVCSILCIWATFYCGVFWNLPRIIVAILCYLLYTCASCVGINTTKPRANEVVNNNKSKHTSRTSHTSSSKHSLPENSPLPPSPQPQRQREYPQNLNGGETTPGLNGSSEPFIAAGHGRPATADNPTVSTPSLIETAEWEDTNNDVMPIRGECRSVDERADELTKKKRSITPLNQVLMEKSLDMLCQLEAPRNC